MSFKCSTYLSLYCFTQIQKRSVPVDEDTSIPLPSFTLLRSQTRKGLLPFPSLPLSSIPVYVSLCIDTYTWYPRFNPFRSLLRSGVTKHLGPPHPIKNLNPMYSLTRPFSLHYYSFVPLTLTLVLNDYVSRTS